MPDPLFGGFSGTRLAEQDQQQTLLNMMQLRTAESQIPERQALGRYYGAQAGLAEQKLKTEQLYQQRLQARMAGGPQAPAGREATKPEDALRLYMTGAMEDAQDLQAAGKYLDASKVVTRVTTMQRNLDTAAAARVRQAHSEYQVLKDRADYASRLMNSVEALPEKDRPTAFRQALLQYQSVTGDSDPTLANLEYSPKLVKAMQEGTMTALQKAKLRISEEDLKSKDLARRSRVQHERWIENMDNFRKRETIRQEVRASKAGDPLTPPNADIKVGADYVLSRYPDMTKEEARDKGKDLAIAARKIMKGNPALSGSEALGRAYIEMKRTGAFAAATLGSRPASAMALPSSESELKDGKYYITAQGIRKHLGGGKFGPEISPDSYLRSPGGLIEDDSLDDDEED